MILYRSDRRGGKTSPEAFATDGLLTKQVDSGDDPEPHKKYGWITTIVSHIHYKGGLSKFIYDTTAFLSFTADPISRDRFLAGKDKREFVPCDKGKADAYVFTAQIDLPSCNKIGTGLYLFTYNCNFSKLATDQKFRSSPMLLAGIRCNLHSQNSGSHYILLIDAITYLRDKQFDHPEAFKNASRDKEWLMLPCDPMTDNARGFQSRIFIADFWTVSFYSFI
jgi:hypothetical protein